MFKLPLIALGSDSLTLVNHSKQGQVLSFKQDSLTFSGASKLWKSEGVQEALAWATELHEGQKRAHGEPYIVHPIGVGRIILQNGGTQTEIMAGILHDVVEDQGGEATALTMREKFGDEVADIVLEASEDITDTNKKTRKQDYLDRILTGTPSALMVISADKLYNLRSATKGLDSMGIDFWDALWPPEQNGGKHWTPAGIDKMLWFYDTALCNIKSRIPDEPRLTPIVGAMARQLKVLKKRVAEIMAAEALLSGT